MRLVIFAHYGASPAIVNSLSISASMARDDRNRPRAARRSLTVSHVERPPFHAPLRSPFGPPLPCAPR